jgi:hypothetical protein
MTHIGRYVGAVGLLAGTLASPAWAADTSPARSGAARQAARPAASAPAAPAEGPAVTDGQRSMGADELARVGRQMGATPATTIYQATLPDGTFELSDRPPSSGATGIDRRSYALPQHAAARERAEAEREYWRRQAEAFERRRSERDRALEQSRRVRAAPPTTVIVRSDFPRGVYHGYGWMPPDLFGAAVSPNAFLAGGVSSVYTSSPGAVRGRDVGFIGSGFGPRR